ncbi:MAG: hypothetical protein LW630_05735, partial [Saprospiraceae bacterium]|nr:hypothetical protein [Saprospiraceae bacterium]
QRRWYCESGRVGRRLFYEGPLRDDAGLRLFTPPGGVGALGRIAIRPYQFALTNSPLLLRPISLMIRPYDYCY